MLCKDSENLKKLTDIPIDCMDHLPEALSWFKACGVDQLQINMVHRVLTSQLK